MFQLKSALGLPRRFPTATVCAVFLVVLLGLLLLRWGDLEEAKTRFSAKEAIAQRSELNVRNGVGLPKHIDALSSAVAKLEAKLIRVNDIGPNQQYFYEQESAASVKITVLRAMGVTKTKATGFLYQPVRYNVVVEGRFPQVLSFLQGLELGAHHYRLVNLTLQRVIGSQSSAIDNASGVVLNLNLELLASS